MGASGGTGGYSVPMYKGERVTAEYNPKYKLKTSKVIDIKKYEVKETGSIWSYIRNQLRIL